MGSARAYCPETADGVLWLRRLWRAGERGRKSQVNGEGRTGCRTTPELPCEKLCLTVPAMTPETNRRWKAKETADGITNEMNAPPGRPEHPHRRPTDHDRVVT